MRLLLFPVTSKRSLIYCQKLSAPPVRSKPRLDERIAARVGKTYASFEQSDKKWKQLVVRWTGKLLDTVQFEENGLKSLPPLNTYMRTLKSTQSHISDRQARSEDKVGDLEPIQLLFPSAAASTRDSDAASRVVEGTMKEAYQRHRKQAILCFAGLPLTIPFAINPFIPNFPGIYLVYRIWSNWKALNAAKHLQFLLRHEQLAFKASPELNEAYEKYSNKGAMTSQLASAIHDIFKDEHLYRELNQAVRQTARPQETEAVDKQGLSRAESHKQLKD